MDNKKFDVIIVGAGIAGSIIAKELCSQRQGLNILMLEAGPGKATGFETYQKYNDKYFHALAKTPNSPYPDPKFAPSPSVLDVTKIAKNKPDTNGYFVQHGPEAFLSNYNRNVGGTTLHWLGTTLRMLPNDFKMKTLYGVGKDWPISYEDMQPYYRRAEHEIGVTGEVDEQQVHGIQFKKGYVYPMHKIPQSYLDLHMIKGLEGVTFESEGVEYDVNVVSTPQGRNGMPNHKYRNEKTDKPFTPVGAVGAPELGQRCEGNSNCVPICPVQAKYNAVKTLHAALQIPGNEITILPQSPVSTVEVDPKTNKISKVHYKTYETDESGAKTNISSHSASATIVVLTANAIENAKILLASNACTSSGQVGKNLMDHLTYITWGVFPKPIGAYRGPGSTSGMPLFRDGAFRNNHSAFIVEIGNWGWSWPANTPESTLLHAVNNRDFMGETLIKYIKQETSREFRIGWEMEQLPSDKNYVTIDEDYKDALGNYRPVIHYDFNHYEMKGALVASKLSKKVFRTLGVRAKSEYRSTDPGYFRYEYKEDGEEKVFRGTFNGTGHVVGCHRMGDNADDSVVDSHQRSHDHPNLFVAGAGSFPTLATSNPTLTLSALSFRTADEIAKEFKNKR